ncbi:MAG: PEP/pyruvate-binding domain-containing protein, partial [Gammaproteobacteria bacterium]|nr:PEP/pyruvate-binding domain-containing protein [Gammaproteobacteria bacterium]
MARFLFILICVSFSASASVSQSTTSNPEYRQWIESMQTRERGPFKELRWFCNDGTILPPRAYACVKHDGGYQHGAWSEQTQTLRDNGYKIANLLAGYDPEVQLARPDFLDDYNQLLIEKYLVAADDGWILRRALFYRGAIQEEDEREGGRKLLLALSAQPEWIGLRYPALRTGAILVSHGQDTASVQKVRQVSAALAEQDRGFNDLRGKIHGTPDAGDAQRVRDYAAAVDDPAMKEKYEDLAAEIDLVYQAVPLPQKLEETAGVFTAGVWLQKILRSAAADLEKDPAASNRYQVTARLLADLREALPRINSASARLRIIDLSLDIETENFSASAELREQLPKATRHQHVVWLKAAVNAAYGTGAINPRGRKELQKSLAGMEAKSVSLTEYMEILGYLARVPGWGTQGLRYQFYGSMQKLAEIEPQALLFIQDQLRGSPLLFYSQVLDDLLQDANRLAGVEYKLFGKQIGVGFRALNPGLARGVLHARPDFENIADFEPHGIYLLPETVSELPPVAGIMTAGEGNPLSHVQLLARNLGIPNVGVDEQLLSSIQKHDGEKIVMAVSPSGLVELSPDGPKWDAIFGEDNKNKGAEINPDLEKLDLTVQSFLLLDDLRAADSGRTVGPKAAKLGELRHHYPGAVAEGVAIPFGVFKASVLDKPYKSSGKTVFEWMVGEYDHIHQMPADSAERRTYTNRFRDELYNLIANAKLDSNFRKQLRETMARAFGPGDNYGVFVRSDTNVEDLAGFTGAGLNLTLPNVVGVDNVIDAIPKVWASPFTARAFAWRQSHMAQPEHVYPAVLLLRSVSNDKSGVMVTQDIDTGDTAILSVAVNEGVGGAVDGQSAESVRIDTRDGSVRVLAMATAPWRRNPNSAGGVDKLPASGSDTVLQPDEIKELIIFVKELPEKFPPITDDAG